MRRGLLEAGSAAAGTALAAVFGATARIRPTAKPLHPRGFQVKGILERHGCAQPWGVPWVDEPGDDPVLIRFSRAMGLPAPLPDILGLTVRVQLPEGHADLLLATTGRGAISRLVLLPRRDLAADYGSLMAYRTPAGPLWLFARCDPGPTHPRRIQCVAADARGRQWPFGEIELAETQDPADPAISFDPILNPIPGLELYPWERRLREGAYAAARSSRA